jgi:hypothetical protein
MRTRLRRAFMLLAACFAMPILHADEPKTLIDIDNQMLRWEIYRSRGDTCVLKGTAVSEMRDDAFEVQFKRSLPANPVVRAHPRTFQGRHGVHRSANHSRPLENLDG